MCVREYLGVEEGRLVLGYEEVIDYDIVVLYFCHRQRLALYILNQTTLIIYFIRMRILLSQGAVMSPGNQERICFIVNMRFDMVIR